MQLAVDGHEDVDGRDPARGKLEHRAVVIVSRNVNHNGRRVLVGSVSATSRSTGVRGLPEVLDLTTIAANEVVLVIRERLPGELLLRDGLELGGEVLEQPEVGRVIRGEHAVAGKAVGRRLGEVRKASIDVGLRLHVPAVVLLDVPAAHLGHHLLGVEHGVMLELGVAAQIRLEVLTGPSLRLHEVRVARALGHEQGVERVEPLAVEARVPDGVVTVGDRRAQALHLAVVVHVVGLALVLEDAERLVRPEGRRQVERGWQERRAVLVAHVVIDELLEDALVDREALSHESEALDVVVGDL